MNSGKDGVLPFFGPGGSSSQVRLQDVTTDGSWGIVVYELSQVNFDLAAAGIDVIIDNPSGGNFNGAIVSDGSSLNLNSAKLRISNAGQPLGFDTGAVLVTNGSALDAGPNLLVSNSQGQGVFVTNDSHAHSAGSSITGGQVLTEVW